jgi:hypothetical protein
MKLPDNATIVDYSETPDRHSPMSQRVLVFVLIAIPCLMIVFGLLTAILIRPNVSNIIYGIGGYLPIVIGWVFLVLNYSLLKNNPRLRRASMLTFRSYAQSVMGLDEREKLVIDQAFRTSYRIIALTCLLALVCALINVQALHLPYHPGSISIFYITCGAFGLLFYLPKAIVAWKEDR